MRLWGPDISQGQMALGRRMNKKQGWRGIWPFFPMIPVPVCAVFVQLFLVQPVSPKVFATQMSARVIDTQYGKLRGVLVTLPNRALPQVEAYLGLQYASLHGGELRFMPPTSPMEKWGGIRVALKFRPVCPQMPPDMDVLGRSLPVGRLDHFKRLLPFLENQSEECLNLNIYVPVKGRF